MLIIKCFKSNSINPCYFHAYVINQNNQFKMYKSNNGIISLKLPKGVYKIFIFNMAKIIYYNGKDLIITFISNFNVYKNKFFILTDANYEGLKIGKGKLILNGI